MIKVLIADDEPLVQIGIKSMINWAEHNMEICGTAMNGEVALQMIEEKQPEIVITDIRMPMIDGLELVRICRERYGQIPVFLILTSYEEFQLVKQALSYQVVDYLVKLELDAASLSAAVKKAEKRLDELRDYGETAEQQPLQNLFHEKFYMRLLYNLFDSEQQFERQMKDLNLDFSAACYVASHCEIHEAGQVKRNPSQLSNLLGSSFQMIREILSKHMNCHMIALDRKYFAVIFYCPDKEDASRLVEEAMNTACTMVNHYFNVWVAAGIGAPCDTPLRISESYQEARQAFALASPQEPRVYFEQLKPESFKNSFNLSIFKNEITKAFAEFDTDVLHQIFTDISELFLAHPHKYLQAMDGACNLLYLAISLLPDGEDTLADIFSEYSDGYRSIYRLNSVEQITEWMTTLRNGLCQILLSKRKTYKDQVITSVHYYINAHIMERLSLNEVADIFGISSSYLSVLFKKAYNTGFSEYVTQLKIAKAKTLLLEQDLKIYEVADRLGFESSFYFSKVFKKVEGISPRDYLRKKALPPKQ